MGEAKTVQNNSIEKRMENQPERAQPSELIDSRALTVWRITGGIVALIVCLLVSGVVVLSVTFAWPKFIPFTLAIFGIFYAVLAIFIIPPVRWRRWRYEVSEVEIDLMHGVFVVERTLIPMVRVQHVDTSQGPLLRRYGLATVTISTAGGQHQIPALAVETADELRDRIAILARVTDDV